MTKSKPYLKGEWSDCITYFIFWELHISLERVKLESSNFVYGRIYQAITSYSLMGVVRVT